MFVREGVEGAINLAPTGSGMVASCCAHGGRVIATGGSSVFSMVIAAGWACSGVGAFCDCISSWGCGSG